MLPRHKLLMVDLDMVAYTAKQSKGEEISTELVERMLWRSLEISVRCSERGFPEGTQREN